MMDDSQIIQLFLERSQNALVALEGKYGLLCKKIAKRILGNEQDAQECVNDTLLAVWNNIPPNKPQYLISYVCKIEKNIALKRFAYNTALKRNSYYDAVIEELEGTLAAKDSVEKEYEAKELIKCINQFLSKQNEMDRIFFVKRYWFMESVSEIADTYEKSNNYVTVHLHRTRKRLKQILKTEGFLL